MVFKRKPVKLKAVDQIYFTVFLGSLLITMVHAQTTKEPLLVTEFATEILNITDAVPPSTSSSSVLTRLTFSIGGSSKATSTTSRFQSTGNPATSMPSSSNLQSTQSPSSLSAMTSTIQILATTTSDTKSASPADQGTTSIPEEKTTNVFQTSSDRTTVAESDMRSTERGTTPGSQMTTLNEQYTSSPELQTKTPAATSHAGTSTVATSSEALDIVTTKTETSPANAGTTDQTSKSVTVILTQSTETVVVASSTKVGSNPPIKTKKPSLPLKTTADTKPTASSSSSASEPLLSIPQWFAVFLGTFLTIFLIFLTNTWYKAKMTPDNSKPSIELIKNDNKNDRPKSWQDSNVPLDFMSLHIELPKESEVEMKCAENLAFEGDQPDNPGFSSNSSFEVVSLTKL